MNVVLAVSVILVLGCCAVVRISCILGLRGRKHLSDRVVNILLCIATISLIVFTFEVFTDYIHWII